MEPILWSFVGALAALALAWYWHARCGFVAQEPDDYADQGPVFDIRRHLDGHLLCQGVIYGPSGRVVSRFEADMDTVWTGNEGVMSEEFRYDSGETQHRKWLLTLNGDGSFDARADDVIGRGVGRQAGAGVHLSYRIRLPQSAGGHVLKATDWMYMLNNGTIVNRSQFRKFGFRVAELVATISKP